MQAFKSVAYHTGMISAKTVLFFLAEALLTLIIPTETRQCFLIPFIDKLLYTLYQ